jgi:putative acetyltransferase
MNPISEELRIVERGLDDPQVVALVDYHIRSARAQTVEGSAHAIGTSGLMADNIRFWSAWDGEILAGIGAVKTLSQDHGEIKSMHTAMDYRGRGVGSLILKHIIAVAREMGMTRLSLETGSWDYFKPAHTLYSRHGFVECEPFGDYKPDVNSLFFTLNIVGLDANER